MSNSSDQLIRLRALSDMESNDPPIEVGAVWACYSEAGATRRIRILARYPGIDKEDSDWIYEELPGGSLKLELYRIGRIPEFNLRYIMQPEIEDEKMDSQEADTSE